MAPRRGRNGLTLLTTVRDGDLVLVTAAGEIDVASVGDFRAVLSNACGAGEKLVVDLTRVGYLSCAGLRALEETSRARPALSVVATGSVVLRAFAVSGVGAAVPVRPRLREACAAARA
ncbi:STAS domain-containing protein [Amycolatopsis jiangsuensis]|uniref:Anti-anti-sigma factor n=1 Tax=Amycolatopsis jiangsuensis TaxID=1181879 RepID=A0A840ILM2_9PSEU|nr:STAS domain-containing protein [Amycolatopsis jiangsuensis]MBB4683216.1 anti-anti-sigma factor [Amycolatopsis jiangsuensis]